MAWEIITGNKRTKKVYEELFSDRKSAFKKIREMKELGVILPLYTKKKRCKKT